MAGRTTHARSTVGAGGRRCGWRRRARGRGCAPGVRTPDAALLRRDTRRFGRGGPGAGPAQLPDVPTLAVKALKTYSNGDIVRWIVVGNVAVLAAGAALFRRPRPPA